MRHYAALLASSPDAHDIRVRASRGCVRRAVDARDRAVHVRERTDFGVHARVFASRARDINVDVEVGV